MKNVDRVIVYPKPIDIIWVSQYQTCQYVDVQEYAYILVDNPVMPIESPCNWVWTCETLQGKLSRKDYAQLLKGYIATVNGHWVKSLPELPEIGSCWKD